MPEKFIYLPNQFWQHKNHALAFEALARQSARGLRAIIVSTGNLVEYRRPAHIADLIQRLSRLNLREQFIMLGQVPQDEVFQLMRQSLCVLNPSKLAICSQRPRRASPRPRHANGENLSGKEPSARVNTQVP